MDIMERLTVDITAKVAEIIDSEPDHPECDEKIILNVIISASAVLIKSYIASLDLTLEDKIKMSDKIMKEIVNRVNILFSIEK